MGATIISNELCVYTSRFRPMKAIIISQHLFHKSAQDVAMSRVHSSPVALANVSSSTSPMTLACCGRAPYLMCRNAIHRICSSMRLMSPWKLTSVDIISENLVAKICRTKTLDASWHCLCLAQSYASHLEGKHNRRLDPSGLLLCRNHLDDLLLGMHSRSACVTAAPLQIFQAEQASMLGLKRKHMIWDWIHVTYLSVQTFSSFHYASVAQLHIRHVAHTTSSHATSFNLTWRGFLNTGLRFGASSKRVS